MLFRHHAATCSLLLGKGKVFLDDCFAGKREVRCLREWSRSERTQSHQRCMREFSKVEFLDTVAVFSVVYFQLDRLRLAGEFFLCWFPSSSVRSPTYTRSQLAKFDFDYAKREFQDILIPQLVFTSAHYYRFSQLILCPRKFPSRCLLTVQ